MPSKPKRCSASRTSTATTTTAATALKIISANGPVATSKRGNQMTQTEHHPLARHPRAPFRAAVCRTGGNEATPLTNWPVENL